MPICLLPFFFHNYPYIISKKIDKKQVVSLKSMFSFKFFDYNELKLIHIEPTYPLHRAILMWENQKN